MSRGMLTTVVAALLATTLAVPGAGQERQGAGQQQMQGQAAQDAEAAPYLIITHYQVALSDAQTFTRNAETIREAAEQAGLGAEFGWTLWRDGDDFFLASPRESLSSLEDPEAFMRQFEGTPGQQTLERAFQGFEGLDMQANSYVVRSRPEWSYEPERPALQGDPGGAYVIREWTEVGSEEELAQNQERLVRVLREVDFPYPAQVYQVVVGDLGRLETVVLFDDLARFYGENSLESLLEATGQGQAWGNVMETRQDFVRKLETFTIQYVPDASYNVGTETAGAGEGG